MCRTSPLSPLRRAARSRCPSGSCSLPKRRAWIRSATSARKAVTLSISPAGRRKVLSSRAARVMLHSRALRRRALCAGPASIGPKIPQSPERRTRPGGSPSSERGRWSPATAGRWPPACAGKPSSGCPVPGPGPWSETRAGRSAPWPPRPPLVQPVPQGDDAVEPQEESLDQAPPAQSQDPPGQKPQPPAHRGPHPRQPGCPAQHLSQHQGQHRSERPGGQRPPLDQQHRQTPRRQQKRGRSVTDQARELRTQPSGPGGGGGQSGHRLLHFRRFSGRKTPFFRVITGKIGGKIAKNRGNRLSR